MGRSDMTKHRTEEVTEAALARIFQRQDTLKVITVIGRPGALALIAAIEWLWFSPKGEQNDLYQMYVADWSEMKWVVAAIPISKLEDTKALATKLGMRIANGVPTMIEASGMSFFIGGRMPDGKDNMTMYTIENDHGSPVYKNKTRDNAGIKQAEIEVLDGFVNGVDWTPEKIADYIYGTPSFIKP